MIKIVAGLLLSLLSPSLAQAQGFLAGNAGLDPRFCDQPAPRQTVVYIDDMLMQDGKSDWANVLFGKLRATLAPGEKVAVVALSPADGQSHEIWSGCWPDYPAAEREKLGKSFSFFTKNPIKALDTQQGYFASGFAGALSDIFDKHHRADIGIQADDPPQKAILAAISSDGARYAQSKVTVRAVVYSDLAENSEVGSIFRPVPVPPVNYGKKLGTYLRGSVFYAFGVDTDVHGGQDIREITHDFWTAALGSMSATIGGLGSDLNVPNALPIHAYDYSIDLKEQDAPLSGRLSLLVDADNGLVDSWIGISRLSSAALAGTMSCDANGACTLRATTSRGVLTDSPSETLTLSGGAGKPLTGQIGVKASDAVFPLTAVPIANR